MDAGWTAFFALALLVVIFRVVQGKGRSQRPHHEAAQTPSNRSNMYNPVEQRETDRNRLLDFIRKNPFGTVITHSPKRGISATKIMLNLKDSHDDPAKQNLVLLGHVSKANNQWQDIADTTVEGEVLVIFARDEHAYISPRFYLNQAETVPAWDYSVVHARGRAQLITDRDAKLAVMSALVDTAEQDVPPAHQPLLDGATTCPYSPAAWRLQENCTQSYLDGHLAKIVVFSINVESLQGRFKLSQNRTDEELAHVSTCLLASGSSLQLRPEHDRVTPHV